MKLQPVKVRQPVISQVLLGTVITYYFVQLNDILNSHFGWSGSNIFADPPLVFYFQDLKTVLSQRFEGGWGGVVPV